MLGPTTQPPVELRETSVDLRVKHVVCNGKVLTSYKISCSNVLAYPLSGITSALPGAHSY